MTVYGTTVTAHGGAKPGDRNFATVRAIDDEIITWLERRERRKAKRDGECRELGRAYCTKTKIEKAAN
jgi:hypothetical protein